MTEKYKNIPASYLVLIKDNKVLMSRRFNTGYEDGKYSFPAGHVEANENFTDAVIRETKEEIGVILNDKDLKVLHVMHRYSGPGNERIDVFFTADKWQGNPEIKEPNKCDDLKWFDLDSLPENIVPYIKKALDDIKDKVFYSEFGW